MTMSYQMPVNNGIIRGGGSLGSVVKMDLISIWGIVIPVSLIMAFVVKASPIVVVCCLNADQVFKCIPAFIKVNYGKWLYCYHAKQRRTWGELNPVTRSVPSGKRTIVAWN